MTAGAVMGFCVSAGLLLAVTGWMRSRRPTVEQRVLPYVRDVHPRLASSAPAHGVVDAFVTPVARRLAAGIGDVLGGTASVQGRLVRLGSATSVDQFRLQQLAWGAVAFGGAVGLSLGLWSWRGTSTTPLLVLCLVGAVLGVLARDQHLTRQVRARERRLQEELPVVADLLALAVAAGESPVAGLERIHRVCHGELGDEVARVLSDIRTGTPMADAFDALAGRTGVTSIARFAEGLAIAIERGTPLVDVLHAQAADVRESTRRELMELGGRKEVAMMLPVVFLILPVTVVFAFFPGYIGLHLTSGG